jgi:hypothetical protein
MTKTEKLKMQSKMRRLCRAALRKFATDHQLKVEREEGHLKIFSPDRRFYVSERPHGEALHCLFEPGYGSESDWEWFFGKGICLSYVSIYEGGGYGADNLNLDDARSVKWALKSLRGKKSLTQRAA